MRGSTSFVPLTAKSAGLTATLVLGLIVGLAPTPASAHSVGHPTAIAAQHGDEATCDQAEAAVEAAAADAVRQLEVAFRADRRAIETLKAKAGEDNKAARDLLRKAAADLQRIFSTAQAALDVDDEDEDGTACAAPDLTAFDGVVATATTDMATVVTNVTLAVAALPAVQPKNDQDDEDDD